MGSIQAGFEREVPARSDREEKVSAREAKVEMKKKVELKNSESVTQLPVQPSVAKR